MSFLSPTSGSGDSQLERALAASMVTHAAEQKRPARDTAYDRAIAASLIGFEAVVPSQGGLPNIGNTCYLNSLIQAVFKHGSSYRDALTEKAHAVIPEAGGEDPGAATRIQIEKELRGRAKILLTIIELSEKEPTEAEPLKQIHATLKEALLLFRDQMAQVYPQFKAGQHDPGEAFLALSQFLELEVSLPKVDIQTHLQTKSGNFSHFKEVPEAATMVVLASKGSHSIQEAISKQFMTPELMQGVDQVYTSVEEVAKTDGYKTDFPTCSGNFADQIIIQAPRFAQRVVPASKFLIWELKPAEAVRERNNDPIDFEDQIVIPIFDPNGSVAVRKVTLELVSVIGHRSKTTTGGHYVSYVKEADGNFTLYNDSTKTTITSAEAKVRIANEGYQAVYRKVKDEVIEEANAQEFGSLTSRVQNFNNPAIQMGELRAEDFEETPPLDLAKAKEALERLGCSLKEVSEDVTHFLIQAHQTILVQEAIGNTAKNVMDSVSLPNIPGLDSASIADLFISQLEIMKQKVETAQKAGLTSFEFEGKIILEKDFSNLIALSNLASTKEHKEGLILFIEAKKAKVEKKAFISDSIINALGLAQSPQDFESIAFMMSSDFTNTKSPIRSIKFESFKLLIEDPRLTRHPQIIQALRNEASKILTHALRKVVGNIVYTFKSKGVQDSDVFTINGASVTKREAFSQWEEAISGASIDKLMGLSQICRISKTMKIQMNGEAISSILLRVKDGAANGHESVPSDNLGLLGNVISQIDQLEEIFNPKPVAPVVVTLEEEAPSEPLPHPINPIAVVAPLPLETSLSSPGALDSESEDEFVLVPLPVEESKLSPILDSGLSFAPISAETAIASPKPELSLRLVSLEDSSKTVITALVTKALTENDPSTKKASRSLQGRARRNRHSKMEF